MNEILFLLETYNKVIHVEDEKILAQMHVDYRWMSYIEFHNITA